MAEAKVKKISCTVSRAGVFMEGAELEIGSKLSLTESQAKSFAGKIELPKPKAAPAAKSDDKKEDGKSDDKKEDGKSDDKKEDK